MEVNFKTTPAEARTILAIVGRALSLNAKQGGPQLDRMSLHMDIVACHKNGNPLDLDRLYAADDFNFAHDVFGIVRHIDRSTGQLGDMFSPRYHARTPAKAKG